MATMQMLTTGTYVQCKYGTHTPASTQGTRWRRVLIVEGPHDHHRFKHGQILRVQDLTDPDKPGRIKSFYVHRFLKQVVDVWAKRMRYDRRQPGARRVQWDDEEQGPKRRKR